MIQVPQFPIRLIEPSTRKLDWIDGHGRQYRAVLLSPGLVLSWCYCSDGKFKFERSLSSVVLYLLDCRTVACRSIVIVVCGVWRDGCVYVHVRGREEVSGAVERVGNYLE